MFRSIKASPAGHVTTGSFYLAVVFRFRRSNYTRGAVWQSNCTSFTRKYETDLSCDTSTLSWPLPNTWKQLRRLFRWHGRHDEERESCRGWKQTAQAARHLIFGLHSPQAGRQWTVDEHNDLWHHICHSGLQSQLTGRRAAWVEVVRG